MSQKKKSTLVGGVAIMSIAGIISKVIGMAFRLPLGNMIGPGGMGIFQAVYNTYGMLLAISTAGIPVAISRLVSENVTSNRPREARAILRTALIVLGIIGLALTVVLIVFSGPFAARTGDAETALGYVVIAPCILLVSLMAAFRGYMQGRSQMTPTAISQLIEQVAKLAFSYPLAMLGMRSQGIVYAAVGALAGITIGELLALLYMMVVYAFRRKGYIQNEIADETPPSPGKTLAKRIIMIAIPITIGSMIVPIASFIDTAMIRLRLQAAGFDQDMARSLFGLLSGYAIPMINVPTVLATAICVGLVPAISAARVEKRLDVMHETSTLGLRLASLIGMPCTVGMSMLSTQIIQLIYRLSPQDLATAGDILSISSLTIVLFIHVQATTGILQGAGMHKIPMYSLVVGVLFKIAINYILVGIPSINIYGAPVASIVCYLVAMLINLVWIVRKLGLKFDVGRIILRPGLATVGMAAVVFVAMRVLDMTMRRNTLITVLAAVAVYIVLIFAFGALKRSDMEQIPGGKRLEKLLVKMRVWR